MSASVQTNGSGNALVANVATQTHSTTTSSENFIAFALENGGTGAGGTMTDNALDNRNGWTKLGVENNGSLTTSVFVRNDTWSTGTSANPDTITYTGSTGATAVAFFVFPITGGVTNMADVVRQIAVGLGVAGVAPTTTFANPTKQGAAVITAVGDNNGGAGVNGSPPAGYTSTFESVAGARITAAFNNTVAAGVTTVTWGTVATAGYAAIAVELNAASLGVDMGHPAVGFGLPPRGFWKYNFVAGTRDPQLRSPPMFSVDAQQNVPIEVRVFLRDKISLLGWTGPASQIVVSTQPTGSAFATVTPTSVTSRGNGWFSILLTAAQLATLGLMPVRAIAPDAAGSPGSLPSDEVVLNVVAIDGGQIKANSLNDNYTYNANGLPITWRLRVFASKTACDAATPGNPNGTDGEVERYLGSATYNVDGTLATYKFDKDL